MGIRMTAETNVRRSGWADQIPTAIVVQAVLPLMMIINRLRPYQIMAILCTVQFRSPPSRSVVDGDDSLIACDPIGSWRYWVVRSVVV